MTTRPREQSGSRPFQGFSFFGRIKLSVALVFITLLIEASVSGLGPLALRAFLDRIVPAKDFPQFSRLIVILAGGALLAFGTGLLRVWLATRAQGKTLGMLRHAMFDRLQRLSLAPKTDAESADLINRFSVDFEVLESAAAEAGKKFILPALEAIVCSGLMIYVDWRVGLVALVFSPWIILAPILSAAHEKRSMEAAREAEKGLLRLIRENLGSQVMIRAFELEKTELAAFRKRNSGLSRMTTRARTFNALVERVTGSGIVGIRFAICGFSAWFAVWGSQSIGSFASLQVLAYIISNALFLASTSIPTVRDAARSLKRIRLLLKTPPGVADSPNARFLPPLHTEIGLSDVHFSFGGDNTEQITGLTARIPKGSYVAFVGPGGCGKSTLLKLLLRFYDPSAGRITIDGHDLKSLSQSSLRSRMGFVLHENTLFNLSVRENIRAGKPDATEEAVFNAARATGLHEIISELAHGYDSLAGDRGVRFSNAGMQRMAIARAILRNPEIVILDEATSGLDPVDEAAIREILKPLRHGRTVISVSHRLSTVADAEHIFFMDKGAIVEQGSHYELLGINGMYAANWRKQAGFTFSSDGRHVDVDAQRLKSFPILEDVDDEVLAELAPYFATESFPPNREIVRQNDPGDKFYIIARGEVEVWQQEEKTGGSREITRLQDGDFFAESTLLAGFPHTATVRTVTYCTCISLERGHFNRIVARFPALQEKISDIAVNRLNQSGRPHTPAINVTRPSALAQAAGGTTGAASTPDASAF